eukprot:snap_masked-scaffold_81-processed-gene-0.10-mRNA-1 protein AED:1.00 eAED:1.00 QI:0/0/0/0/1/1/2/0/170
MKFGSGRYLDYLERNYLPFRSKQQISTKIQRLCNLQSIDLMFTNLGLSFKNTLESKQCIKIYQDVLTRTQKKIKILSLFSQEVEITSDPDDIRIPYFRITGDLKHLRLMKEEYSNFDDCKLFLSQFGITSLELLESKILSSSEPLAKTVEGSEVLLNDLYKSFLKLPSYW